MCCWDVAFVNSRYEFEKKRYANLNDVELKREVSILN